MTDFLSIFLNVVLPVFGIVIIGYLLGGRLELQARTLSRAAYYVFVPAYIFQAVGSSNIALDDTLKMIGFIILAQTLAAVTAGLVGRLLGRTREMIAAYIMVAVFANVGNYGIAVIHFRFGDPALAPATIYYVVMSIVQFVIGIGAAGWARGGGRGALGNLFKTPAILAVIPAILVSSSGVTVPLVLSRMIGLLAGAMIPTMLFTLGLQLLEQKKIHFSSDVLLASSIRLLAAPALAFIVAIPFSLPHYQYAAGILQIAMPTAIMATIVAKENNIAPDFINASVLFSILTSLVTLPFIMMLF